MFEFGDAIGLDIDALKLGGEYDFYQKHLPNFCGIIVGKREQFDMNVRLTITHYWAVDPTLQVEIDDQNTWSIVNDRTLAYAKSMNWYKLAPNIKAYIGCCSALVMAEYVIHNKIDIIVNDKETYNVAALAKLGYKFLLKNTNSIVEIVEVSHDNKTAWAEVVEK